MKRFRPLKPFLGLLFLVIMISSCNEELPTTGKLKVTFTNHPDDLAVNIFPAENASISISPWLKPDFDGKLTYNLNSGNYILKTSSTTTFSTVGFQIRAGETTTIFFEETNIGHVVE